MRRWSLIGLFCGLFAASASMATGPAAPMAPDAQDAQVARTLDQVLSNPELTYSSRTQDRVFLLGVIDRYLDTLDPSHIFFTVEDEAKFKADPRWVRASLQGRALVAPLRIFEIYRERYSKAMLISQQAVARPAPVFPVANEWVVDRSSAPRPHAGAEWEKLWLQAVQNDRLELQAAGHNKSKIDADLARRYKEASVRMSKVDKDKVLDLFLDAYARSFDPHSNYFAPQGAADFAASLSLSMEGIGAVFQREDTGVLVKELIKGGPAEKAGLVLGDRLSAVGPDASHLKSTEGMDLDAVVNLIRGKKNTSVILEVYRKTTGKLDRITIVRDVVQIENEQKARWKMVEEAGQPKVAVVSLPLFYHDFSATDGKGNSAAADVSAALVDAKKAGAQAVVLDLTGNGGGSLTEAVDLVGLFAPPSPVVQVRLTSGRIEHIPSKQVQPVWTGPLAVLIDGSSASASEITAAALQDLSRALVVGERSFGKGTVQTLLNLDEVPGNKSEGGLGQVKLTTAQFFRPSGASTQLVGVTPDIELVQPGAPAFGERSYSNALPAVSIKPAPGLKPGKAIEPSALVKLQALSAARLPKISFPTPPSRLSLNGPQRQKQLSAGQEEEALRLQKLRARWPDEAAKILIDEINLTKTP